MGKKRTITIGSAEEATQKEEARVRREAKKAAKGEAEGKGASVKGKEPVISNPPAGGEKSQEDLSELTAPRDDTTEPTSPVILRPQVAHDREESTTENSEQSTENKSEEAPKAKRPSTINHKPATDTRSPRHSENLTKIDKNKVYTLGDALTLLSDLKSTKMDETLELHINTNDKMSGSIVLPHGTGKITRVAILAPTQDPEGAQKLLDAIDKGQIDFDILIATPDAMARLAKAAKILGPKGLMPNPKNGTVTPHPQEAAEKFAGGQMNYKTEAKANLLHIGIGKMSFGKEKLSENVKAFLASLDHGKIKSVFIKSTMSPALRIK